MRRAVLTARATRTGVGSESPTVLRRSALFAAGLAARRGFLAVLATMALLGARPGLAGEPIVATDLLRIRSVSSIDVARDGSLAVYAVRSIAEETPAGDSEDAASTPRYANRSHLFALDMRDGRRATRQLTWGTRRDTSPVISPDGRRVAFVRVAENGNGEREELRSQVWVLDLRGGEARQMTMLEHGAFAPRWSPDGRWLLVHSSMPAEAITGDPPWPMERPRRTWGDATTPEDDQQNATAPDGSREEIRRWLAANAEREAPLVINRLDFQGGRTLDNELRFTQLVLVSADDPEAEPIRLTDEFFDHSSAAFISNGERIVYVTKKPTDEHPDRVVRRTLWTIGSDGSDDRLLLSLEGWSLSSPVSSTDGTMLAFNGQRMDHPSDRPPRLGVVVLDDEAAAAEPAWLTDVDGFDFPVRSVEWVPNQPSLLFTAAKEGGVPLLEASFGMLDPAPVVDRVDDQPAGVLAFGVGGTKVVYAVTSPTNPCMLRMRDPRDGDRIVHDLNEWVATKTLSMPRGAWLDRPDRSRIQYWIMEPTNSEPGRQYPLALQIHGGPAAMWGPGEFTMWHEFQLLCSWGYGVVYANPRGSGGYGYEFQRANHQNWGDGPAGDVLAAVDKALLEDWVDPDRLVVTGGSYAGYLTAWIVGHDHRFKAAVAQRGVYDLTTFFGEGNAWRLVPWAMGGYPWEAPTRTVLQRESPFTYVDRIRTPLLIMHASQDLRTGVSQSEMLYRALKELGRDVEYVRYPNAGHDLSRTGDPTQRLDRVNRIVEFFERHIDNSRPAPMVDVSAETGS
jgi:dipeptidyl aminopeptidase/acylaminoacyl peptidase